VNIRKEVLYQGLPRSLSLSARPSDPFSVEVILADMRSIG